MIDCAKNIVILKPGKSLKVSFTKLSGVLKKILTQDDEGSFLGDKFMFDGLLPIDIKKPLFEEFDLQLDKRSNSAATF